MFHLIRSSLLLQFLYEEIIFSRKTACGYFKQFVLLTTGILQKYVNFVLYRGKLGDKADLPIKSQNVFPFKK